MLIGGATFADIVRLRDGSDLRGNLKSCDEAQCFIGSKKVPMDRIAVIELRAGAAIPPKVGDGAVVLTDGSVHRGHFTGLSLGTVDTDEWEIGRDSVAIIIVAADGVAASARDVVIFRNASQRVGRLQSCTPASCLLDGERLRIEDMEWIGLRQESNTPPSVGAAGDLVYVGDKPQAARMSSVQPKKVRDSITVPVLRLLRLFLVLHVRSHQR